MRPVGLTSVTFRQLSVDEIIALARETGCTGIEWGSDVHIKPKQLDLAGQAAEACRQNQLAIFSRLISRPPSNWERRLCGSGPAAPLPRKPTMIFFRKLSRKHSGAVIWQRKWEST